MNYNKFDLANGTSAGASFTSSVWQCPSAAQKTVQIAMTGGSPVGSFSISGSTDGVNYAELSSQAITSAADTVTFVINLPVYSLKVDYTRTSGSSTVYIIGFQAIAE